MSRAGAVRTGVARARITRARAVLCALVLLALMAGCTEVPPARSTPVGSTQQPRAPYVALADAVVAHGAQVWVEVDLVKAWQAGPARYREVLDVVANFAARPGVVGVKIADELGYNDGTDGSSALAFLKETTAELHRRVPGRKVLIDVVVPEFGCLAWQGDPSVGQAASRAWAAVAPAARTEMQACAKGEADKNPGSTLARVDSYVQQGGIDVLDLSAGLRSDAQYPTWGTTRDDAMTAIWDEASRRWGGHVTLNARKALAHPGAYDQPAATADRDVHTFVDIPLAHGASAVDIWTWSQNYQGGTYLLTNPGLADNALVAALRARRAKGAVLWTHMTPSSLQRGVAQDVAAATAIFGAILVTAGTG